MAYPSDLLFYATYNSSLTADYSKYGTTTPDASNDVSINSSIKNCGAGSLEHVNAISKKYVRYAGGGEVVDVGTIEFYMYVDSGAPAGTHSLFRIYSGTNNNLIELSILSSGFIQSIINNSAGANVSYLSKASAFSQDVWVHVSLAFDIDSGNNQLFVDGTDVSNDSATGSRASVTNYLYFGHHLINYHPGIFIDNAQIYNTKRRSSNFTPSCDLFPGAAESTIKFGFPFGGHLRRF
jgi:hypothetical protein